MPHFSAKMHQIQFRLGAAAPQIPLGESSSWLGGGWLPPLQELIRALGPLGLDTLQFFRDPTILAPKPKSQTAYNAQGRHVILSWIGTPTF